MNALQHSSVIVISLALSLSLSSLSSLSPLSLLSLGNMYHYILEEHVASGVVWDRYSRESERGLVGKQCAEQMLVQGR